MLCRQFRAGVVRTRTDVEAIGCHVLRRCAQSMSMSDVHAAACTCTHAQARRGNRAPVRCVGAVHDGCARTRAHATSSTESAHARCIALCCAPHAVSRRARSQTNARNDVDASLSATSTNVHAQCVVGGRARVRTDVDGIVGCATRGVDDVHCAVRARARACTLASTYTRAQRQTSREWRLWSRLARVMSINDMCPCSRRSSRARALRRCPSRCA